MKNAFRCLWLSGLVALPLAACNQTASTEVLTTGSISASAGVPMPGAVGCHGEVNRYKAVMNNDQSLGQVGQSVFDQIQREINDAALACVRGHDAESVRLIQASRARHGYL